MLDSEKAIDLRPVRDGAHAEALKLTNLSILTAYNLTHALAMGFVMTPADRGDRVVVRVPNRFTVEFFTRKNRWRTRGVKKSTHGNADDFIRWFETQLRG